MPAVNFCLARAERNLGVVASIEREPSGDLWLVLRSRSNDSIIAQARVPTKQNGNTAAPAPSDLTGSATGT